MSFGDIMLDKNTHVKITWGILIMLLGFAFYMGQFTTSFEAQDERLDAMIYTEACARKAADAVILSDLGEIKPSVIEIKTKLAGIETSLEWLINERRGTE